MQSTLSGQLHHSSSKTYTILTPPSSVNKRPFASQDENVYRSSVVNAEQIHRLKPTEHTFKRPFAAMFNIDSFHDPTLNKKIKQCDHLPAELNSDNEHSGRQMRIAHAVAVDSRKRILRFNPSAPFPKVANISKNAYQPKLNTCALHVTRRISTLPEKTLATPGLADNYYNNVLDWSSTNVVAIALDTSVYLWHASHGTIQTLGYLGGEQATSVNWSSDGSYLAVGTAGGDTQIWDAQSNTKLRSMRGQNCRIGVLGWDKSSVTSGAQDGSLFSHDVRAADHVVRQLHGHEGEVCGLKWRWDGELLATGGNDNTVNIWDARSSTPRHQKQIHNGAVKALSWSPWSHNLLATGGGRDDGKIHFWNASSGLRSSTISTGSQVTSLSWSHHYHEIASTHGYPYNQVSVWSYPSMNKIIDIPAHDSRILYSALSPDGQTLATAAADQNLKFWRIFEANGKSRLGSQNTQFEQKNQIPSASTKIFKGLR